MIGAHQPQRKSRARLITALRWAAALAVFAILFHFLPVAQLRRALASVPPIRFAIILIIYLCAHAMGILKWRMVVNAAGSQLDFTTSAQCYLGGLFGTLFLPSIIGGDVIRMAVGLRRSPRPAAVLAGSVVDRFLAEGNVVYWPFATISTLAGALAARIAVGACTPAYSRHRLVARRIRTSDIHTAERAFSHLLRPVSAFAGLVVRVAVGQNCRASATYTRRNGRPRSRSGRIAVAVRCARAPGAGFRPGVGRNHRSRRAYVWICRVCTAAHRVASLLR